MSGAMVDGLSLGPATGIRAAIMDIPPWLRVFMRRSEGSAKEGEGMRVYPGDALAAVRVNRKREATVPLMGRQPSGYPAAGRSNVNLTDLGATGMAASRKPGTRRRPESRSRCVVTSC